MCKRFSSVFAGFRDCPSVSVKAVAPKAQIEALRARGKGVVEALRARCGGACWKCVTVTQKRRGRGESVRRHLTVSAEREGMFSGDDVRRRPSWLCSPRVTKGGSPAEGPRASRIARCEMSVKAPALRPSGQSHPSGLGVSPAPPFFGRAYRAGKSASRATARGGRGDPPRWGDEPGRELSPWSVPQRGRGGGGEPLRGP